MKPRVWVLVVLMAAAAAVCGRLGFWQLARLATKREANTAMAAALALPPVVAQDSLPSPATLRGRRLEITGHFDEHVQFVLRGRERGGDPGVEVVTPFVIGDGSVAVLVNRGWLHADDAVTARPEDYPEPGSQTVIGVAESLGHGHAEPMRRLAADQAQVYSVQSLDSDSIAPRLHYAPASFVLRQLPGRDVPERPHRLEPEPLDEMIHIGYALQWFLFATAFLAAAAFVLHRARAQA